MWQSRFLGCLGRGLVYCPFPKAHVAPVPALCPNVILQDGLRSLADSDM